MKKTAVLVKKEILDILRDKKTLIMMLVVPILLYPLIMIGMTMAVSMFMQSQEEQIYTVGMRMEYAGFAQELERVYQNEHEEEDLDLVFVYASPEEETKQKEQVDVWLDITEKESADTVNGRQMHIELEYASTDSGASLVCDALEELMIVYQEELVIQKLTAEGISPKVLEPLTYERKDTASLSESLGMDIGGSIGMLLITTILLGAMYPAIDATAGEKERGTLETILTLPVTNFQLIASKYISVAIFACVTAVISILSLGGSVIFLIYGLAGEAEGAEFLNAAGLLSALPVLIAAMITTALLISALCMCFCVFAKSFKEANNYITPLMLVIMFSSMAAMIPTILLDYRTALIPVVNVSLMVKQIISGQLSLALAGETIAVNAGYSILIVWILSKIYNSEDILFTDGFKSVRLFRRRSEIKPGTIPEAGDLVIGMTVLFLLVMYLGSAASVHLGFWGTAVNQVIILFVPLLIVWYMKSDVKKLFLLQRPVWKKVPASLLLYVGAWCTGIAVSSLLTELLPQSTQNLEATFEPILEQPVWMLVLVIAVMPAVCEEIMFRGFLFGSLRCRTKLNWAILVSGLVFGAFHMSLVKLIPTFLLGAAFAMAVSATGSIFVSMGLHFINNLWSVLIMKYPEKVETYLPFIMEETLTWPVMLGLLAVGIAAGAAGILLARQKREA